MKKVALSVFCAVLAAALFVPPAQAELDVVVNVMPASLLINVDDAFVTTDAGGGRLNLSSVYMMPNISAGLGVEIGDFLVDFTVGAGIVVNESFRSFMFQAQVAALYSITDSLEIGPHAGIISFPDPTWIDDADMQLDGTTGWILGIEMGMGDRIMYLVSVDVISAAFDVDSSLSSLSTDQDELSITALAVQFGVRGEF